MYGELKNVMLHSVQIPNLPVWCRKLPRFMGVSIGPRMEICETLGLPIPMVSRLHQSNGYMIRKLGAWRAQNYNAIVGAETVVTSAGPQITPFMGVRIGSTMEICEPSEPTNPRGTAFPPKEWLHQKDGR